MTQAQKPEALDLAQFFERMQKSSHRWHDGVPVHEKAAAMLRALHTRIAEMEVQLATEATRTAEQKLRAEQMSQQHDTQAALNREAREQLAALKEKQELNLDCKSVQKRLATQWGFAPQAQDVQIEAGAKRLSELFDYPWAEMPAAGRENMRKNVRDVLDAIAASAAQGKQ